MVIVDANIVTSASENGDKIQAARSRAILDSILLNRNYKIGISNPLCKEYKDNWSHYGKTWYFRMKLRGRIDNKKNVEDLELRNGLLKLLKEVFYEEHLASIREKVRKDIHLLELSLLCDNQIIISDEGCARDRVRRLSTIPHRILVNLRVVIWLKPDECICHECLPEECSRDECLRDIFDIIKWIQKNYSVDNIPNNHYLITRSR